MYIQEAGYIYNAYIFKCFSHLSFRSHNLPPLLPLLVGVLKISDIGQVYLKTKNIARYLSPGFAGAFAAQKPAEAPQAAASILG